MPYVEGKRAPKHLVHGEWMTIYEAARRLGIPDGTLRNYRYTHRRPDGGMGLLVDAWDHYKAVQAGKIRVRRGIEPQLYWVNGRHMTMMEAAALCGVRTNTLRGYIKRHRCSVNAAVRRYGKRAVREIVAIIAGG